MNEIERMGKIHNRYMFKDSDEAREITTIMQDCIDLTREEINDRENIENKGSEASLTWTDGRVTVKGDKPKASNKFPSHSK